MLKHWSLEFGLLQDHARRWVAHTLTPKLLKAFIKDFFKAKGKRGAYLVVANFLVSDPLFLKSGHSLL